MTELRIVVGSGPSSVAVTQALLLRGFEVVMLDVGERLDERTGKIVAAMAQEEPEQWSVANKRAIQRSDFKGDEALSPKRIFGSSYPYHLDPKIEAPPGMRLYGSRAYGGLSTLWGCALLQANDGDIADWPQNVRAGLIDGYRQIGALIEQSTGANIFAPATHLRISGAAQTMLDRSRRFSDTAAVGVFPTPLAVSVGCKACNGCMYGCVYGFTYNSGATVENVFMKNGRFRYLSGLIVERFEETGAGVKVHAVQLADGRPKVVLGKQLFLAAGMMGTLRIVWNSSPKVSRTVYARDSSCMLVPGIFLSAQNFRKAQYHGLSHLSLDLKAPPFDRKPAHFQLYFNNPAVADGIAERLRFLPFRFPRSLIRGANRFLLAAQGYIHSDFCHRLRLECSPEGIIRASVEHNADNPKATDTALSQLSAAIRRLGAIAFTQAASVTPYGGSKTAGALPHASMPTPETTDQLGRPWGVENVFIVDGTVMPSVPSRNHTLTMMANASRIGQSS